ncbi:MAG: Sensor protein, partial [bacterium]|nr:Sensor protein [bacterium]
ETAKEEIQSTNEELSTVNDELHSRNQELSQVNADLINLLDTVDIPMLILDAERRIRRFTPKARRLLNVLQSDVGRLIDDIKPNVNVDLERMVAETIASGTIQEAEVQEREACWYRMQIRPYKTAEGQSDGAFLSLIDIDALKHNVTDAEWARDYAIGIVEAVQVPLVVLDDKLRALSANRAFYATFQTTAAAVTGRKLFEFDNGAWDIPRLRELVERMLSTRNEVADAEISHTFPRIGERVLRVSACGVQSHTDVPMMLVALEDITMRKRAEHERNQLLTRAEAAREDAERANASKDEFLAMLSHELRTPLSTLLMQSQLLRRGAVDLAKVHRISETIERNTRLQVQLIDDLLDVSRIVAGKLTIEPESIDLAAIVRRALELVSGLAEAKSVVFTVDLEEGIANVSVDPMRMTQVVSNLLTNAIKFSAKGGRASVAITTLDGQATVRVSDEGRGIESDFLPHIFDRFMQQDSSTTRMFGGLGLGLAIVRHIVELHGGTVRAESAGSGLGATFWVTLPLVATRAVSVASSAAATRPRRAGVATGNEDAQLRGLRVLVIDDDRAIRETTVEILTLLGAAVVATASSESGLEAIAKSRFDVILCDIAMPEQDGFGFIRQLRQLDAARGGATPAIAFTALAGDDNRQRSLDAGFQLHLAKPVDVERLTACVLEVAVPYDALN